MEPPLTGLPYLHVLLVCVRPAPDYFELKVGCVAVSKNTIPSNRNFKLLYKNTHNQTHDRERKNDQTRSNQQTMNRILEYLVAHKDWLLLVCFSVDAVNTLISFPLIMWKGPKWLLKSTDPDAKEKVEDADAKAIVDLTDTDRKSFKVLWEIFGICYEGYFGFTISTLICLFKVPGTRPIFAYSLFALYLYKAKAFLTTIKTDNPQGKGKLMSILFFYWPCYGGYCLLHSIKNYFL